VGWEHAIRTFSHMAAEVVRLYVSDLPLPCFICIDVHSTKILANVV
jgi:hypothetical protein